MVCTQYVCIVHTLCIQCAYNVYSLLVVNWKSRFSQWLTRFFYRKFCVTTKDKIKVTCFLVHSRSSNPSVCSCHIVGRNVFHWLRNERNPVSPKSRMLHRHHLCTLIGLCRCIHPCKAILFAQVWRLINCRYHRRIWLYFNTSWVLQTTKPPRKFGLPPESIGRRKKKEELN